jgi:hypothetical protein
MSILNFVDSLAGWVDQACGRYPFNLEMRQTLVTFTGTEKVADLVFTTKNPGQGELAWYTGETESYFTNSSGNPIPAEFQTGEVKIYEPPEIILDHSKTFCTGQFASLMSIALGNQPPIDLSMDLSRRAIQPAPILSFSTVTPGRCRPLHPARHRPRWLLPTRKA